MTRMTPAQLKAWRQFYAPRDAALKKANLTGKDLVRWKYQRYAKNYLRCVRGVDESVGHEDRQDRVDVCVVQAGLHDMRVLLGSDFRRKMHGIVVVTDIAIPAQRRYGLVAKLDPRILLKFRDKLALGVNMDDIHLFDPQGGNRL